MTIGPSQVPKFLLPLKRLQPPLPLHVLQKQEQSNPKSQASRRRAIHTSTSVMWSKGSRQRWRLLWRATILLTNKAPNNSALQTMYPLLPTPCGDTGLGPALVTWTCNGRRAVFAHMPLCWWRFSSSFHWRHLPMWSSHAQAPHTIAVWPMNPITITVIKPRVVPVWVCVQTSICSSRSVAPPVPCLSLKRQLLQEDCSPLPPSCRNGHCTKKGGVCGGGGAIISHTASVLVFEGICYGQIGMNCYVLL